MDPDAEPVRRRRSRASGGDDASWADVVGARAWGAPAAASGGHVRPAPEEDTQVLPTRRSRRREAAEPGTAEAAPGPFPVDGAGAPGAPGDVARPWWSAGSTGSLPAVPPVPAAPAAPASWFGAGAGAAHPGPGGLFATSDTFTTPDAFTTADAFTPTPAPPPAPAAPVVPAGPVAPVVPAVTPAAVERPVERPVELPVRRPVDPPPAGRDDAGALRIDPVRIPPVTAAPAVVPPVFVEAAPVPPVRPPVPGTAVPPMTGSLPLRPTARAPFRPVDPPAPAQSPVVHGRRTIEPVARPVVPTEARPVVPAGVDPDEAIFRPVERPYQPVARPAVEPVAGPGVQPSAEPAAGPAPLVTPISLEPVVPHRPAAEPPAGVLPGGDGRRTVIDLRGLEEAPAPGARRLPGAAAAAAAAAAAGGAGVPVARRTFAPPPAAAQDAAFPTAPDPQDAPATHDVGPDPASPADPFPVPAAGRTARRGRTAPDDRAAPVVPGGGDGPGAGDGGDEPDGATERRGGRSRRPRPVPGEPTPKAGRNLPAAIAVGLGLAGLVVASLVFRKEAFVGVVSVAVVIAVWEIATAMRNKDVDVPLPPLAVGAVGMLVSAFVAGPPGLLVAFALTAFGVLLYRIIEGFDGAVRDVAAGVFTAAYVPFLAGFAMLLLAADDGVERVVLFVLVTVCSDIGGYAAGVLFGRHPMAPTVSPKKSWEGFAGSVVACAAAATAAVVLLLDGQWWAGPLVGVAVAVSATLGDLSESLLKRDLGVKDMGNLLPGHGGLMDRLDSLLLTAPVVFLLLAALVPAAP